MSDQSLSTSCQSSGSRWGQPQSWRWTSSACSSTGVVFGAPSLPTGTRRIFAMGREYQSRQRYRRRGQGWSRSTQAAPSGGRLMRSSTVAPSCSTCEATSTRPYPRGRSSTRLSRAFVSATTRPGDPGVSAAKRHSRSRASPADVDRSVREPRAIVGKPATRGGVPLHGRALGVAPGGAVAGRILELVLGNSAADHADFLAVVEEWGTPDAEKEERCGPRPLRPVAVLVVPRDE